MGTTGASRRAGSAIAMARVEVMGWAASPLCAGDSMDGPGQHNRQFIHYVPCSPQLPLDVGLSSSPETFPPPVPKPLR